MKISFTRLASSLLVFSIAAGGGIALTTLAYAQTAAPATAPVPPMPPHHPPMGEGGPGMHGGHGHRMMMEVERLKTSLKLNASQTALWDKAQGLMKPPTDTREQMRARDERMVAMLDDPNFDPRKLAADMDGVQAERKAAMTSLRDAWFAVYDSLNPVQRGQAREFLRSHLSRPHGMRGRGEWMREHEDQPGRAPMPPR